MNDPSPFSVARGVLMFFGGKASKFIAHLDVMLHMYLKTKAVQTEKQGKNVETSPHDCCRNKDFRNRLLCIF